MTAVAAAPVGSWLRVLAWTVDQDGEHAHLGVFGENGTLLAVFRADIAHQIHYLPTDPTPPFAEAGMGVAVAGPAPDSGTVQTQGGGSGPVGGTSQLQGQGTATRFGSTGTEAGTGDSGDTEATRLVEEEPVPGQADISPGLVWP